MAIKFTFGAIGILGNQPGNLDAIGIDSARNNDFCIVIDNYKLYWYRMNQYLDEPENPPFSVAPNDIDINTPLRSRLKKWVLISQREFTTNIIQQIDKFIQTSHIKANPDNPLDIEASNGEKIVLEENGRIIFPVRIYGVYPENWDHATTKEYVDIQIQIIDDNTKDYLEASLAWLDNSIRNYVDNQQPILTNSIEDYWNNTSNTNQSGIEDYTQQKIGEVETDTKNYTDEKLQLYETDIKDYTDTQAAALSGENYSYSSLTMTTTGWNAEDGLYYSNVSHNLDTDKYFIECWKSDLTLNPERIEKINNNKVRIYMETNENITVNLFYES